MFNALSNAACTNAPFTFGTLLGMGEMHPSMRRLYEAAKQLTGAQSQSDLARLLNTTSQRINNWETRGLSEKGAIEAEAAFGVSPLWLLEGVVAPLVGSGKLSTGSSPGAAQPMRPSGRTLAIAARALTRFLARRDATLDVTQEVDAELLMAVAAEYEASRTDADAETAFVVALADLVQTYEAKRERNGNGGGSEPDDGSARKQVRN